jgi:hypothetical protein
MEGQVIAEPRDVELLVGLAKHKFKSDERVIALLRKIAGNNVEFHKGHSELTELLTGSQAAMCLTCYAHQFSGRIRKGAPLKILTTEGIGSIDSTAVFKNAPHPNAAILFARWADHGSIRSGTRQLYVAVESQGARIRTGHGNRRRVAGDWHAVSNGA